MDTKTEARSYVEHERKFWTAAGEYVQAGRAGNDFTLAMSGNLLHTWTDADGKTCIGLVFTREAARGLYLSMSNMVGDAVSIRVDGRLISADEKARMTAPFEQQPQDSPVKPEDRLSNRDGIHKVMRSLTPYGACTADVTPFRQGSRIVPTVPAPGGDDVA